MNQLNQNNMDKDKVLEWYDNFAEYVLQYNSNLYNSACEYADEKENN